MTAWRLAKSLEKLREEINALYPGRSKESDGTIGNAEHASRSSDHNPWVKDGVTGVVTAMDITNDPRGLPSSQDIADALVASRDDRIKYVISNRKICSGHGGPSPWVWRPYSGANPHNHHVHVSVVSSKAGYDDAGTWNLVVTAGASAGAPTEADPPKPSISRPVLRRGAEGVVVRDLQRMLGLPQDGKFGAATEAKVKARQRDLGLVADGVVGRYTWEKIAT